jgi:hypothetical protein
MTVVLGGIALIAGKDYIVEQQQIANITSNWVVYTLELGASFTVGIVVLLTGVRMMIAELVPAFKGISDKLIPNSVPGLDMPIFFPLAPLSSILGFIGAFVGEFVGFAILLAVGSPILMIRASSRRSSTAVSPVCSVISTAEGKPRLFPALSSASFRFWAACSLRMSPDWPVSAPRTATPTSVPSGS